MPTKTKLYWLHLILFIIQKDHTKVYWKRFARKSANAFCCYVKQIYLFPSFSPLLFHSLSLSVLCMCCLCWYTLYFVCIANLNRYYISVHLYSICRCVRFFFFPFSLHQRNRISSIYCCKRWFYLQWLTFVHVSQRCNLHFMDANKNISKGWNWKRSREKERSISKHSKWNSFDNVWHQRFGQQWSFIISKLLPIHNSILFHGFVFIGFMPFFPTNSISLYLPLYRLYLLSKHMITHSKQNKCQQNTKMVHVGKDSRSDIGMVVMSGNENRNSTICYTVFI